MQNFGEILQNLISRAQETQVLDAKNCEAMLEQLHSLTPEGKASNTAAETQALECCRGLSDATTPNAKKSLETYWLQAAQKNWVRIIQHIIDHKLVDINQTYDTSNEDTDKGWTALTAAAACGHVDVVRILLEAGVPINQSKTNGATALFLASQNNHREVMQLLLERGADVNQAKQDNVAPLLMAARCDSRKAVELLLKHKAKVNETDTNGMTPLLLAAFHGNGEMTTLLLRHGADHTLAASFTCRESGADTPPMTPIQIARKQAETFSGFRKEAYKHIVNILETHSKTRENKNRAEQLGSESTTSPVVVFTSRFGNSEANSTAPTSTTSSALPFPSQQPTAAAVEPPENTGEKSGITTSVFHT